MLSTSFCLGQLEGVKSFHEFLFCLETIMSISFFGWTETDLNPTVMFRLRLIYLREMHTVHSCTVPLIRNVTFQWLFRWSKQVFYIFRIPSIGIFGFQGLFVFINIMKAKVGKWDIKVYVERNNVKDELRNKASCRICVSVVFHSWFTVSKIIIVDVFTKGSKTSVFMWSFSFILMQWAKIINNWSL